MIPRGSSWALAAASAARQGGRIAAPLSWAPLRWLGGAAYRYYLIHGLVLKAVAAVMHMPYWWMLVPAFAATLAGTAVLHYAVEQPLSLARPKRASPGTPSLPVAAVARSKPAA